MKVNPAAEDTGIRFLRTDLSEDSIIRALAHNVSSTARSTNISEGGVDVNTVEHLLSALTGMGIDNALIEIDNVEVPILDGSASYYVKAFAEAGVVEQNAERRLLRLDEPIEVVDEKSGSWLKVTPSDEPSYDVTADFGSRVLGVQKAHWDPSIDYATQIAVCRTFVFFHEIEFLLANNLIKGGDVDNALVVVEHPVSEEQIAKMAASIGRPTLRVLPSGYLNNANLHFPDETGRHKLLDLMGDLRLVGGFLGAKVEAFKPGHTINSRLAKILEEKVK